MVLDTDLVSELLKQRDQSVVNRAVTYLQTYDLLTFTSLTALEILSGLERIMSASKAERANVLFSQNEEIVPDAADYRLAAQIMGRLGRIGTPVGLVDPMIASCAIRRSLGVASGNSRHFEFIRQAGYDFHFENWREP